MLVTEMDDEHLCNSIDMIQRGHDWLGRKIAPWVKEKLPILLLEHKRRMKNETL